MTIKALVSGQPIGCGNGKQVQLLPAAFERISRDVTGARMQMKLPAFQFYPGDWMKDPAVRAVSLAARGLWIDMLCLMHESSRRGYLQHESGGPVIAEQLARMTGCSPEQVEVLLSELESVGVFSRAERSVIYCRRMVRDERKRELCAEAGKRGGNPTLKGQSKGGFKGDANPPPTPSSSSSASAQSPLTPQGGKRLRPREAEKLERLRKTEDAHKRAIEERRRRDAEKKAEAISASEAKARGLIP